MGRPLKTRRSRRDAARGYDLVWARWLLTFSAVALGVNLSIIKADWVRWATLGVNAFFGLLVLFYFGHILLRRLQCSLLEFCVLALVLGNLLGLVFSLPGVAKSPFLAVTLGLFCSAWVLHGMVAGFVQAELLKIRRAAPRALYLVASWWGSLAPVLLAAAAALFWLPRGSLSDWIAPPMFAWRIPFVVLGTAGTVLRFVFEWRARRAARQVLGEITA